MTKQKEESKGKKKSENGPGWLVINFNELASKIIVQITLRSSVRHSPVVR